jgi:acyl carrier protein
MDIYPKVIELTHSMGVTEEIKKTSSLMDLGFDSIMIMELIVNLEEKFDINILDEDIHELNFQTVESVHNMILPYLKR